MFRLDVSHLQAPIISLPDANTPGGDTIKLTQLSIINKESRNVPTPTVIQRHPRVEYPVNISALKRKEFYALVVSCLNTACK